MKTSIYISLILIFFIILVSFQYTLNKIYKILKDIRDIMIENKVRDRF